MQQIWAVVVMFGLALAAVVALLVFVPSGAAATAAATVTGILAMLSPVLAGMFFQRQVGQRIDEVGTRVDAVHEQVNGRFSELISRVNPQPPPGRHAADGPADEQDGGPA